MEEVQALAQISGRVQGVYFRAYTRDMAQSLGLKGYVRNLPTGEVEAVFAGPRDKVDQAISWCHQGSPSSWVDKVKVSWEQPSGGLGSFDIRY